MRADYDQTVSKYNQLQSDYNSVTLELGNYKLYTCVLLIISAALGIALLFIVYWKRQPARSPIVQKEEPQHAAGK